MPAISKSVYILSIIDAFIIALAAMYTFISFIPHTILLYIALWFLVVTMQAAHHKVYHIQNLTSLHPAPDNILWQLGSNVKLILSCGIHFPLFCFSFILME